MKETPDSKAFKAQLKQRTTLICALALLSLLLIAARLFKVQIIDGAEHEETARRQSTRLVVAHPVRGQIFSADSQILAGNTTHYDLVMNPSLMRIPRGMLLTSSYMLKIATFFEEDVLKRPSNIKNIHSLRQRLLKDMAQPVLLYSDLTADEIARCEELSPQIRGVSVVPRIEREHPFPGIATHILGTTGWKHSELKGLKYNFQTYTSKALRGTSGLEKKYDLILAGNTGAKIVFTDPSGFVRGEHPGSIQPVDGMDIHLTIDSTAQIAADNALRGKTGALVAINPMTGAVLAMASSPSYNLETISSKTYGELIRDIDGKPLLNRAIQGCYMPGSIVKPLIALAALEHGTITADTEIECPGYYKIGAKKIRCANRYGHGTLNLEQAIAASCNPWFIHTGLNCGADVLESMYSAAGFGKKTNIGLDGERAGLCPSRNLAPKLWKRKWQISDTAYASIGQGAVEATPLQAAVYAAALANGGRVMHPYLVDKITTKDGLVVEETVPELRNTLPASREHLEIIRSTMKAAVETPGGSASALRSARIPLAAKTGTAEVGQMAVLYKNTWIICYDPSPVPAFAVACVIEKGDSGGRSTAPVVVDFLTAWLNPQHQ